jgi:hypothetical protein
MKHSKRLFVVVVVVLALVATTLGAGAQAVTPGQGSTDVRVMNLTSDSTAPQVGVTAEYYNQAGTVEATKTQNLSSLATYDFLAADSGLYDGWKGSMVVSSTGEVAALGTTTYTGGSAPASVGSYRGFDTGATSIYFPNLQQRPSQYSVIAVQNADSGSADVSIYYYARNGVPYAANPVTDSIPSGAQRTYDLSQKGVGKVPNLGITTPPGDGWLGAVRVVSTNGKKLAGAVVNFNVSYSTAYPAALQGANTLYFAAISRRISAGSWLQFSGTIVQNLDEAATANVTVYVTDRLGAPVFSFTDAIPALSAHGYNTRFQADTPAGQWAAFQAAMGDNFNGAMYVTSDKPVVGLTDQQSLVTGFVGQFSYLGEASGGTSVYAPQVYRVTCSGIVCQKSTGVIVYNPDASNSAAVTVRFINTNGSIAYQFNGTVPARSSQGYNTRVQADTPAADFAALKTALGDSFKGSVWVTSDRPIIGVAQHFVPNEGDAYNAYSK